MKGKARLNQPGVPKQLLPPLQGGRQKLNKQGTGLRSVKGKNQYKKMVKRNFTRKLAARERKAWMNKQALMKSLLRLLYDPACGPACMR